MMRLGDLEHLRRCKSRWEKIMAKINVYVPEPPKEYTEEGFRQINQAISTVENQLNTSYQTDLKNEQDAFNYFMS